MVQEVKPLYPMRINKYLASRGYSTRTEADTLIEKGLITINGKEAVLGQKVLEKDTVQVLGPKKKYRYYAYNKPFGVITHSPQLGEKDVLTASGLLGVFPVGRLDKRSSGLLILTDDARITDRLLSPVYVHEKEYRISTREDLPSYFKKRMEGGVDIEGYTTKKCSVQLEGDKRFSIILTEGKKHQIRRMCAALGVEISTLERVRVANIKIGSLKSNAYRDIAGTELQTFLTSLSL